MTLGRVVLMDRGRKHIGGLGVIRSRDTKGGQLLQVVCSCREKEK